MPEGEIFVSADFNVDNEDLVLLVAEARVVLNNDYEFWQKSSPVRNQWLQQAISDSTIN